MDSTLGARIDERREAIWSHRITKSRREIRHQIRQLVADDEAVEILGYDGVDERLDHFRSRVHQGEETRHVGGGKDVGE